MNCQIRAIEGEMSPKLSRQALISRRHLERIGDERLREARALLEAGCFAGAVYIGGYAVECYLKAAICRRLGWDQLLGVFRTHDLEGLLLYTGLNFELESQILVYANFRQIVGLWNDRSGEAVVRYWDPARVDENTAKTFIDCLNGVPEGLIPWLQKAISK